MSGEAMTNADGVKCVSLRIRLNDKALATWIVYKTRGPRWYRLITFSVEDGQQGIGVWDSALHSRLTKTS